MRKADFSTGKWIAQCGGHREMDCPVRWSLATPSALESQSRANQGVCTCKSHLQVQTPQGRSLASASGSGQAIDLCFERSPFKKGPLGLPQKNHLARLALPRDSLWIDRETERERRRLPRVFMVGNLERLRLYAAPIQRRRNDNINKICVLEGAGEGEFYGKLSQKRCFSWEIP